jgi:hypothetical protein
LYSLRRFSMKPIFMLGGAPKAHEVFMELIGSYAGTLSAKLVGRKLIRMTAANGSHTCAVNSMQ